MEESIYASYIIVGFVDWRETRDQVFWMPFLNFKSPLYFNFLVIDLVFNYLFLISLRLS